MGSGNLSQLHCSATLFGLLWLKSCQRPSNQQKESNPKTIHRAGASQCTACSHPRLHRHDAFLGAQGTGLLLPGPWTTGIFQPVLTRRHWLEVLLAEGVGTLCDKGPDSEYLGRRLSPALPLQCRGCHRQCTSEESSRVPVQLVTKRR